MVSDSVERGGAGSEAGAELVRFFRDLAVLWM